MNDTPSATAILAPIWRRKWLILLAGLVVAAGAYLYYKHKPTEYQSETQLYLSAGAEEYFGERGSSTKSASETAPAQPDIINSIIGEQAHRLLKHEHDHTAKAASKGKFKAKAAEKSQFINITSEARTPKASALLANTVAQLYIKHEHLRREHGILTALVIAKRQLLRVETPPAPSILGKGKNAKVSTGTSQSATIREAQLNTRISQLEAELGVQDVQQLRVAKPHAAKLLGPFPKQNAIFGFVIGILLASLAAFLLGRIDRRLRLPGDVEHAFGAQLLAVLPEVRQPVLEREGRRAPARSWVESLRGLQATLMLGGLSSNGSSRSNGHHPMRSILFVSADAGDGRSSVLAGLALVQGEAGKRTLVVEANFRRPTQARVLGLPDHAGLMEVLSGTLSFEEALQEVPAAAPELAAVQPPPGEGGTALAARAPHAAVVALLGRAASFNPLALLTGPAMEEVLRTGSEEFDHVLLDAPPPLEVGDALPLLSAVDGIVIVARVDHTRERSAQQLRAMLARTPSAPVLGVVANGLKPKEFARYGIATGTRSRSALARLLGR